MPTGYLNWAYETVPQPGLHGRRGYQPRGRTLGGSSAINAMIYVRGDRTDYDDWAALGNTGWGYDEVLPYFKRSEDQARGPEAADSTRALILRAKVVEIAYDGRDIYHRRLAHIFVDGELLAVRLLEYGLAYENVRHFGDNGFPDLADRIIRAADAGPKPDFEPPHKWRKKHQRKPGAATKSPGG